MPEEYVRQRGQPQVRVVGDRTASLGQEGAYLCDGPGDRRTIDAEQPPEHGMRKVMPQMNERGHHPVDEHQLMPGAGTRRPLPDTATCSVTAAFDRGLPWWANSSTRRPR